MSTKLTISRIHKKLGVKYVTHENIKFVLKQGERIVIGKIVDGKIENLTPEDIEKCNEIELKYQEMKEIDVKLPEIKLEYEKEARKYLTEIMENDIGTVSYSLPILSICGVTCIVEISVHIYDFMKMDLDIENTSWGLIDIPLHDTTFDLGSRDVFRMKSEYERLLILNDGIKKCIDIIPKLEINTLLSELSIVKNDDLDSVFSNKTIESLSKFNNVKVIYNDCCICYETTKTILRCCKANMCVFCLIKLKEPKCPHCRASFLDNIDEDNSYTCPIFWRNN